MIESEEDRAFICEVISEMLDNPDSYGIYPTSRAYTRLEAHCVEIRMQALLEIEQLRQRVADLEEALAICKKERGEDADTNGRRILDLEKQLWSFCRTPD